MCKSRLLATSQTADVKIQQTKILLFFQFVYLLMTIGRALHIKLIFESSHGKVQLNKPITVKCENGCL